MLSNDADQFMTTPMPTSITTQAMNPNMQEMPAPRPTSRTGFLPGLAGQSGFLPGFGAYVDAPAYAGTGAMDLKNPKTLMLIGAIGLGAYLMFFRKKGSKGLFGGKAKGPGKVGYK